MTHKVKVSTMDMLSSKMQVILKVEFFNVQLLCNRSTPLPTLYKIVHHRVICTRPMKISMVQCAQPLPAQLGRLKKVLLILLVRKLTVLKTRSMMTKCTHDVLLCIFFLMQLLPNNNGSTCSHASSSRLTQGSSLLQNRAHWLVCSIQPQTSLTCITKTLTVLQLPSWQ